MEYAESASYLKKPSSMAQLFQYTDNMLNCFLLSSSMVRRWSVQHTVRMKRRMLGEQLARALDGNRVTASVTIQLLRYFQMAQAVSHHGFRHRHRLILLESVHHRKLSEIL
jgi:hypothetical protein